MNLLLTVIWILVSSICLVTSASLWDLMPSNIHRQKSQETNQPAQARSQASQGGFWGQILQHSKEGRTQSEKYSSKNSEPLVRIASESVLPAGPQKHRKNIPESLRSLHTLYTDYDDYQDDDYYDEDYDEGNYDSDFELLNIKNNNAEIQTVEDSNVDQVMRKHQ